MLLIVSININGANFFRTKEIFFISLIITGALFADYSKIKPLLLMLVLYFSSFLFNIAIPGSNLQVAQGLFFSMGFLYLFLLVFDNTNYREVTINAYLFSAKIVALLIIGVWILCFISNDIKWQLITYFNAYESDNVAFIFMIRSRKILDWWLPGVYYSTAPCIIPALAYYLSKSIKSSNKTYTLSIALLSLGLFLTAARANMLAVFVLIFMYFMAVNILKKRYLLSILFSIISSVGSLFIIYLLTSDSTESSLAVKALHKESYLEVFSLDYFRTIIFGWGAGSSFFTEGFNRFTMLTELTIYETVRRYGLISTFLIFLFIWSPPLLKSFSGKIHLNVVFLGLSLIIYVLVASTNPFLLGSIGFSALFFFSSAINFCLFKQK